MKIQIYYNPYYITPQESILIESIYENNAIEYKSTFDLLEIDFKGIIVKYNKDGENTLTIDKEKDYTIINVNSINQTKEIIEKLDNI